ncbi:MAG: helix-turn-helix domain-containing protein [Desulfitobacterium sp.]|jgi:Predicted transcriptional regulator|nr:helix-turn-helix transcriptional regulator [Dehalobacter sp.]
MKVSYKKLWKLLIDRDMKKKDLQLAAGLSSTTIAKLSNHENVSMDVLIKVCTILGVDIGDIMELVPNAQPDTKQDNV